jgi:predicted Zn-dependent peptidase
MVNTAPIHCFYVGGLSVEQLKKCLCDILMPVMAETAREANELVHYCRTSRSFGEVRRFTEQGEQGQSHLILGFRSGITIQSPEYYAMMLCNELLGCSPISRLFVHVREEQSLCYACSSSYREQRGDVIVGCGIRAENKERALRAILAQVEAIRQGDFTEAEWQAAKKSLIGGTRQVEDSARVLADFYGLRQPLCPEHTIENYVARFGRLTREDVMAAARRLTLDLIYFRRGLGVDDEGEESAYD